MSKITYQTVLRLISDINTFAEQSDQKIQQLWNNSNNSKRSLEEQYNQFMTKASDSNNKASAAIQKKAAEFQKNAESIYQEVSSLDALLAKADKYYVKTRAKKTEELAQETEASIVGGADIFAALEKVKEQHKEIAAKYSEKSLPAILDGVNYIFSKKRKQDYEKLIVLKNTLERLMREIGETIPELVNDSMQVNNENYYEQAATIKSKYQSELSSLNLRYENNVETLVDEICAQLDVIMQDSMLRSVQEINEHYPKIFSEITPNYDTWDGTIVAGHIDYPLELFVSSNALFSLIKDKCAVILAQKKLLRFPFVFSLKNGLNLLVKHTPGGLKNEFISSVMQSFIASVPVTHLSFNIIDSESQGKNISSFSEFYTKLPDLFDGGIITSNDETGKTLEKLTAYINENPPIKLNEIRDKTPNAASAPYLPDAVDSIITDNPPDIIKAGGTPDIKVLVVFDSPESLGEKNVALINSIIENGSSRGVYTVIGYNTRPNGQPESESSPYREKSCAIVRQADDMFLFYNLHITYNQALEGSNLSKYIKDYLLLYDSLDGNIAILDSSVRELIANENSRREQAAASSLKSVLDKYNDTFGLVPSSDHTFPAGITAGSLLFPWDLMNNPKIISRFKEEPAAPNYNTFNVPAIFNLKNNNNLLITCPEASRQNIEKFVHSLMWSF